MVTSEASRIRTAMTSSGEFSGSSRIKNSDLVKTATPPLAMFWCKRFLNAAEYPLSFAP